MTWARIDDAILDNKKIAKVGMLGFAMHVAAITWCARNLTDGFIPTARVACLFDLSSVLPRAVFACASPEGFKKRAISSVGELSVSAEELAVELVEAGLWKRDEEAGGFWLNDYLAYNPTRESVLAQREKGRERAKVSAERRAASREAALKLRNCFAVASRAPDPDPDPVPEERRDPPVVPRPGDRPEEPEEPARETAEDRYAQAFADGVSAGTGKPCSRPAGKSRGDIALAIQAHWPEARGPDLLAAIREAAQAFVVARPSSATFGGFTPRSWRSWLDSGRPADTPRPSGIVRARPGLAQPPTGAPGECDWPEWDGTPHVFEAAR